MEVRRRINLPRGYFHVMNRGARKVSIFGDEADRRIFVDMLGRFSSKYEVPVLAWCLMPNHYHVESDTDGARLCGMMRDLDGNYARSFNERHDTSGCLFQGPFKSVLIEDEIGVAHVSRYIHLNPVDLGEAPERYRWSSCGHYMGSSSAPDWMDLDPVRRAIRNEDLGEVENYRRYLREGLAGRATRRKADPFADFHHEWIRHLEGRCIERLIGREDLLGRTSIQTLVCYVAHRRQQMAADAIAEYFGYSGPSSVRAICGRLQERLSEDAGLREALRTVTDPASQER